MRDHGSRSPERIAAGRVARGQPPLPNTPAGGVSRETKSPKGDRTPGLMTAVTVMRRLGYVGLKAYEAVMPDLLVTDSVAASNFADAVKPLLDGLLHLEVDDETQELPTLPEG